MATEPIRIEFVRNDLPQIAQNLPGVLDSRMEKAANAAREAGRAGVDNPGLPSNDTGAMRVGMVVQTAKGDDFAERKGEARSAFMGNPSRSDPKNKNHTEAEFEKLCFDLPSFPTPSNQYELLATVVVLMKYGLWFEMGDAWDWVTKAKRSPAPWFGPSVQAWGNGEYPSHFAGVIEEANQ